MAAVEMYHHRIDIEVEGTHHHEDEDRSSLAGSEASYFSDDDDGVHSCRSQFYSTTAGGSHDEYSLDCVSDHEMALDIRVSSCVSECSIEVVEVEGGGVEIVKGGGGGGAQLVKVERDCRICHLGLESNRQESGLPIQLGCSCKDDLAAAHKLCAEAWFKIKGNKTCEICHSVARNVVEPNDAEFVEQLNEASNTGTTGAVAASSVPRSETRRFLGGGHRFLNFLLACMVFAFVISWLFHFNVRS